MPGIVLLGNSLQEQEETNRKRGWSNVPRERSKPTDFFVKQIATWKETALEKADHVGVLLCLGK